VFIGLYELAASIAFVAKTLSSGRLTSERLHLCFITLIEKEKGPFIFHFHFVDIIICSCWRRRRMAATESQPLLSKPNSEVHLGSTNFEARLGFCWPYELSEALVLTEEILNCARQKNLIELDIIFTFESKNPSSRLVNAYLDANGGVIQNSKLLAHVNKLATILTNHERAADCAKVVNCTVSDLVEGIKRDTPIVTKILYILALRLRIMLDVQLRNWAIFFSFIQVLVTIGCIILSLLVAF
jgi:hypothetical protein